MRVSLAFPRSSEAAAKAAVKEAAKAAAKVAAKVAACHSSSRRSPRVRRTRTFAMRHARRLRLQNAWTLASLLGGASPAAHAPLMLRLGRFEPRDLAQTHHRALRAIEVANETVIADPPSAEPRLRAAYFIHLPYAHDAQGGYEGLGRALAALITRLVQLELVGA